MLNCFYLFPCFSEHRKVMLHTVLYAHIILPCLQETKWLLNSKTEKETQQWTMINGDNLKRGKQTYLRTALARKANYCFNPLKNFVTHSITGLIYCTKQSTPLWYLGRKIWIQWRKGLKRAFIKAESCPLVSLSTSAAQNSENLKKMQKTNKIIIIKQMVLLNKQRMTGMRKQSRNTEKYILVHLCSYMLIMCILLGKYTAAQTFKICSSGH